MKTPRVVRLRQLVQGIHQNKEAALANQEVENAILQLDTGTTQGVADEVLHRSVSQDIGPKVDEQGHRNALTALEACCHLSQQMAQEHAFARSAACQQQGAALAREDLRQAGSATVGTQRLRFLIGCREEGLRDVRLGPGGRAPPFGKPPKQMTPRPARVDDSLVRDWEFRE